MLSPFFREVENFVPPRRPIAHRATHSARIRSTIRAIRVAVEIINDPVAVKNRAGAIMAVTVS